LFIFGSCSGLLSNSLAYDRVNITNYSTSPGKVRVLYKDCKHDDWDIQGAAVVNNGLHPSVSNAPTKRGGCLVTTIRAWLNDGSEINDYESGPGTTFAHFSLVQRNERRFRIMSDNEIQAEKKDALEEKMSPGFRITNKTIWPLSIALSQVGCLYYGTIKPGEVFDRNTGAVWFTIEASISADGTEKRKDWDCIAPVAQIVGTIALAAVSGGVFGVAGVAAAETTAAAGATSGALVATGSMAVSQVGNLLKPTSEGSLRGQFAGPAYPFRCTHKPEYVITGGWGAPTKNEKGEAVIPAGTPLKIQKVNSQECG
jgi:hypothetical protein